MKKLKSRRTFFLILFIGLFTGCIKTVSNNHFVKLTKKGNIWHVDKMRIVSFNLSGSVLRDTTFLDPGDFIFETEETTEESNEGNMIFNGSVKLNPIYSQTFGPFNFPFEMLAETISAGFSGSYNAETFFDITYLKKNKLNMFVQAPLNAFYTQSEDYNFYFECTRK